MSVIGQSDVDLSVAINYIRGRLRGLLGVYIASLDGLIIRHYGAGDPDRWAALTATLTALGMTYVKELANLTASNHKHMYTIIRSDKGFILNVKRNDYAITIIDNDPNEENEAIKTINDALGKIT